MIPTTDQYAHAAGVTILTPEGVVSRYLYGVDFPPRDLQAGSDRRVAGGRGIRDRPRAAVVFSLRPHDRANMAWP